MRRIVLALMSTVTAVVLLFGYRTSSPPAAVGATAALPTAPATTGGSTASAPSGSTSRTYAGSVVQTRWGPVQVQITVVGGTVTAVSALQVPSGNSRDAQINAYAVPVLDREAVQAQDADIDAVSGATVTSTGYVRSLQAALDEAGL